MNHNRTQGKRYRRKTSLSQLSFNTDHSKDVLLLWFISIVIFCCLSISLQLCPLFRTALWPSLVHYCPPGVFACLVLLCVQSFVFLSHLALRQDVQNHCIDLKSLPFNL